MKPTTDKFPNSTGVFLDPTYSQDERADCYAVESDVSAAVRQWAIDNGSNPLLRIALCGYDGEHEMPQGWDCDNSNRERIWFSPHCEQTLFNFKK